MEGWISLHRKLVESEIFQKPPLYLKVWIYLLISAQHSSYNGLKPGQVRTSIPEIIEACKWRVGARVEKPTKDQIYQVLEFLRGKAMKSERSGFESNAKAPMITTTKATHGLLITICNYSAYQDLSQYESNNEGNSENLTKQVRKQRQPDNINNNVNNDNNIYEEEEDNARTRANDFSPFDDSEFNSLSDNSNGRVYDFYQSNFGMLSPYLSQQLGNWIDDMNADIVILAMEQALNYNVRKFTYINKILNDWHSQGARTVEQCQALINEFEERRGSEQYAKRKESSETVRHGGDQTESGRSKSPFAFLDEESRVWTGRGKWGNAAQMSEMQGRGGFSDPL